MQFLAGKELYIVRCSIRHLTQNGLNVASSTNGGHAFINDSLIAFNTGGVNVQGTANIASIKNTSILSNTSFAVRANGANNIVRVQASVLNASPTGISLLNGGTAGSVGPSNFVTGAGGAVTKRKRDEKNSEKQLSHVPRIQRDPPGPRNR